MLDPVNLSAAFIIGLLGSVHCVGMCGGIMGALAFAVPKEQRTPKKLFPLLFCYNLGRIFSYTLAGALIGATSWLLADQFPLLGTLLRSLAGLMLIAMGLYLANWWSVLRHLERAGNIIWKRIQPLLKGLMPVNSLWRALLAGTLWGWIPCGLIYSTLTWAATAADWQSSAMMMFFFGLGTMPAVLATGIFLDGLKRLMQHKGVRLIAALMIIAFGLWSLPWHSLLPSASHSHHQHSEMQPADMPQHPDKPHSDTQHSDTQHSDTQHSDMQH